MGEQATSTALVPASEDAISFPGRGLPEQTGLLLRGFSHRYLDPITYDPADVERIRRLGEKGVVVYTHRSANWVDLLFLQRNIPRHNLPRAEYVAGFDSRIFHPVWTWLKRDVEPGAPDDPVEREEWRLRVTLEQEKSALVFLKHPATLINPRPREQAHYARAIIRAQRKLQRPIFLVPQVIIWIHRPGHFKPTLGDVVFGTSDMPGALRAFGIAWLLYRWAKIRVAEPVNVQEFIAQNPGASDDVLARKLRFAVAYGLGREQRVLNGPPLKTHKRMKEETLRDPKLQKTVQALTTQTNKSVPELSAQARSQYDEVASRFDVDVMSLVDWILRGIWNRIYDGMDVDPNDIARIKEVARKATLIMVPCHRSHVDYLVLGQVLYWNGMMPPLVAAGINLSFWPLGPIFRRAGAYFIRRSFKGDPLYPHVVRTYLKHMLREGFTQEFFVEGTRSRTGKTLPPKLGMVSMIVDAFLDGAQKEVAFIPVSIGYEKIVESGSYARELAGAEKEKESIKGLLSAGKVLRHKYGRVYVTFDEPIFLRQFLAERGISAEGEADPDAVKGAVRALGHSIVYGINRATVVTPTAVAALALLGHRRRGLPHRTLIIYAQRILEHVRTVAGPAARISPVLNTDLEGALREAMSRLAEEELINVEGASGEVFYRPNDTKRVYLDYYKNNILHFFVPDAIVSTALQSFGVPPGQPVPLNQLRQRAQSLSRLLKMEFQFRVGVRFEALFEEALQRSVDRGYIQRTDDGVLLREQAAQLALFVSNLLSNFIEGYVVGLRILGAEVTSPRTRKDLVQLLMDRARASFLAGEMRRSEAVNKAVMENVVEFAVDVGLLIPQGEAPTSPLAPAPDLAARVKTLTDDASRFLGGPRET
ncbi:MAG: 1-acyl-sn-glycerol-3-phosphate acyltransferase [Myxococcota bacterium]